MRVSSLMRVLGGSGGIGGGELVDQAFDHAQSERPEIRVAGVEPERLEEFGMVLGPPGLQQLEIALGKPVAGLLILGIKRVHKAVAESIRIDVERRMDEVRDVGPEDPVSVVELDRGTQRFPGDIEPDLVELPGGELALLAG